MKANPDITCWFLVASNNYKHVFNARTDSTHKQYTRISEAEQDIGSKINEFWSS